MKPIVKVAMKYNTGLPASTREPFHLPASWTATVDKSTLPEEFQQGDIKFEASGFARAQALLAVEKQLKSYGIAYLLEVQG